MQDQKITLAYNLVDLEQHFFQNLKHTHDKDAPIIFCFGICVI